MVLVHGLGEHSGRYERSGRLFASSGINVTAVDLRGHGGSGGRRGDVVRWTDFTDDIEAAFHRLRSSNQGRPVVLFGHSMGGLLSAELVASRQLHPDALVLSAPALDDALPRWQHVLAPALARIVPRLAIKHAWPPEALSRDPDVGWRASQDPGCRETATVRLGAAGFAAQRRVRPTVNEFRVPTLVLHGADDPLVPPSASASLAGVDGVTRRVYAGLRHECLNEPEGPAVCNDIIEWLRSEVGDGPGNDRASLATDDA